jgi:hypothetical protein
VIVLILRSNIIEKPIFSTFDEAYKTGVMTVERSQSIRGDKSNNKLIEKQQVN